MAAASSSDEMRKAHFTLIWRIESGFRAYDLDSPTFKIQSMEMTEWRLGIESYATSARVWIKRAEEDGGPESIEIEFELSILDDGGSSLAKKPGAEHFRKGGYSRSFEFIETDALFDKEGDDYFPKDPLIVRCRMWRKGTKISKSELCFAGTRFDMFRISCVWALKEFSSLKLGEKRTRILNSAVETGRYDSAKKEWSQLSLILSLYKQVTVEYVSIHLQSPGQGRKYHFRVVGEIALLDGEGVVAHFEGVKAYGRLGDSIRLKVFEKSKLTDVLSSDDVLILRFKLKLYSLDLSWSEIEDYKLMDYSDSKPVKTEKSEAYFDDMNETTVCPFKEMVSKFKEDSTLSDVSLRAGTKSFAAHKLVLSSRSPVFRAMFTQDMREKTSKCVDIPDLDADTLGRLLSYIYGDEMTGLTWETAANLFVASDQYELLDLKEKCSCVLKSNISESNVCNILVLADMHHDESLKKSVLEFIKNNSKIMKSDAWKIFKEDHSKLAIEIMEQIIYDMKHPGP